MSLQPIDFSGISLASWTLAMTTKYPHVILHHSVTWRRFPGMCHRSNKSQHGLNNCCKHSPHNYEQPHGPVRNSAVYLPRSFFFHYQCNSEILLQNWCLKAQFSYLPVGLHTNCKGNRYRATVLEHRVGTFKTNLPTTTTKGWTECANILQILRSSTSPGQRTAVWQLQWASNNGSEVKPASVYKC